MQEIKLNAELRDGAGKGVARKLRADGRLPAILYGPEVEPASLTLNARELAALIRNHGSSNILIDLQVAGEKEIRKVIFRDLQRDPIHGDFEHVDFYQVSMNKKINLTAGIELVGSAEGVKQGGILQHIIRDIEIQCLPANIPENVIVDVSALNIGDSIHVSDITIENVDIITNPTRTVVTVVPPTIIKTAAEEEEAEGEELAEGEVPAEGEGAPEGEGEGGEGGEEKAE